MAEITRSLAVQHHQRFPHGLDDIVGVIPRRNDAVIQSPELFGCLLQLGDPGKSNHQPVDRIVRRAIGQNPHEVVVPSLGLHFYLFGDQGLENFPEVGFQPIILQVGDKVADRPPDISRDQVHHSESSRG